MRIQPHVMLPHFFRWDCPGKVYGLTPKLRPMHAQLVPAADIH
jgi:hypothetical protein